MRVYLISGDRAAAQDAERVVRSAGFNVFVTDLGEEAISRASQHDYDILVLNSDPLDISGHEFLLRVRRANITTPILVLSDATFVGTLSRGFGFGADEYLTTPVTRDEVTAAAWGGAPLARP
jgi:two-component system, cell cycle response regulator CtrA